MTSYYEDADGFKMSFATCLPPQHSLLGWHGFFHPVPMHIWHHIYLSPTHILSLVTENKQQEGGIHVGSHIGIILEIQTLITRHSYNILSLPFGKW